MEVNSIDRSMQARFLARDVRSVDWTEPGLKIVRMRMLTDPGYPEYDISYCWGEVHGEPVIVSLPFSSLTKRRWKTEVVRYAIADGVNAKRLGIFDNYSALS